MEKVDNLQDKDEIIEEDEKKIEVLTIKSNQSIAESNLMLLPFVSVQNTNVKILKREWVSNGVKRGILVKGSPDLGVPNVKDLDTLLALFRILVKNINYQYEYDRENNKILNFPNEIHFTFQELSEEMGYSTYSGAVKNVLEKSLKRLNETTIYSQFGGAIRDPEQGEYITEFNGEESFRIIYDLKIYSYKKIKAKNGKIGNAKEVRENTSLKIHDFFFKSICNNYFKIYDYSKYLKLKLGISKKLFLILNQWSHGYEKYLTYQVLYDTIGLDEKKGVYYNNRQIKKAFQELVDIGFIDGFEENKSKEGINIIFNKKMLNKNKFLDKYTNDGEIIGKLREIGFTYDDIMKYYRLDNQDYVRGLLRYYDYRVKNNNDIRDDFEFLLQGLKRENYNVEGFI